MKTKFFTLALIVSALVALNRQVAIADDDEGENEGCSTNHVGDCDIDGNETLLATIVLTPTTNAPAGAGGTAKIQSLILGVCTNMNSGTNLFSGTNINTLTVDTFGLAAGNYSLIALRASDTSSVVIAQITIPSSHHHDEGDDDQGENDNSQGDEQDSLVKISNTASMGSWWAGLSPTNTGENEAFGDDEDNEGNECATNIVLKSHNVFILPSDLNPADISQLTVDSNGVAMLTGNVVTNPASGSTVTFTASVRLSSDTGGQGTAQIKSTLKKGKRTNRFTMIANGVPANTAFAVVVNGQTTGTVVSSKKGRVLVRKLPGNLMTVRSVKLVDSENRSAASAKF